MCDWKGKRVYNVLAVSRWLRSTPASKTFPLMREPMLHLERTSRRRDVHFHYVPFSREPGALEEEFMTAFTSCRVCFALGFLVRHFNRCKCVTEGSWSRSGG